jgi:hypothetical protein
LIRRFILIAGSDFLPAFQLSLRAAVAAGLAIIVAQLLELQHSGTGSFDRAIQTSIAGEYV